MKKRLISILFALILVLSLPYSVLAAEPTDESNIIYFEDGSYMTITIEEMGTRASGTKTAKKTYNYTASDDTISWKAVLTGTFTYNGTTATCTAADCDITIYDTVWYIVSNTATKNSNVASADITMGRKVLGITVAKKNYELILTCDKDGNLS